MALGVAGRRGGHRWGKHRVAGGNLASNFPEALVDAVSMRSQGRSTGYIVGLWGAAAVLDSFAVWSASALCERRTDHVAWPAGLRRSCGVALLTGDTY